MKSGCPSWSRPCCGPLCRPTSANRRCQGRTQSGARNRRTAKQSLTGLHVSLIWCHFEIVEIHAELSIGKEAGTTLFIGDGVDFVDGPFIGLGLTGRPGLTSNSRLAVGRVLDAQLEVVPGIRLPCKIGCRGTGDLG